MEFISRRGYNVLTLEEFSKYLRKDKRIDKKNLVLLTFDDGFENNYTYAYDILKSYGLTGVFFVPANEIGDKDRLTEEQILEMKDNGMMFGSHTLNHSYLPGLDKEEIWYEIKVSKDKLEEIIKQDIKSIAYPIGGFSEEIIELVKKAGYSIGFTTNRGFQEDRMNNNPYAVRRIKVSYRDNNFKLWAKLSGIYNLFRNIRDPY